MLEHPALKPMRSGSVLRSGVRETAKRRSRPTLQTNILPNSGNDFPIATVYLGLWIVGIRIRQARGPRETLSGGADRVWW
jgi:hypothetical protein